MVQTGWRRPHATASDASPRPHRMTTPIDHQRHPDDASDKSALRRRFRSIRKAIPDPRERSATIFSHLAALDEYRSSLTVLMFDSVVGEPETSSWIAAARSAGKRVWVPEAPDLPDRFDLVVVPGLAFDSTGGRLGQGGGWYDRFLSRCPTQVSVGVCFAEQLVVRVPHEPHDVPVDLVVCERGVVGGKAR